MNDGGKELERRIDEAMQADRFRLRRQWIDIARAAREGRPNEQRLNRWRQDLEQSIRRREARAASRPKLIYDDSLPVSARREEIAEAIERHQVVVVSGETGSGKSTQLPKICLEIGRGIEGMIGHTQPRRIAARSLAARIASELGSPVGGLVGYKVRFADSTRPETLIKLMTDGILLAETQGDRFLDQYDTLIIDEAHERSLNIDFLLGFLTRLLPRRPDLKVIITSATIDSARFAEHFSTHRVSVAGTRELRPAPLIEVTGRTFPVEIRYRPPAGEGESQDEFRDVDLPSLVVQSLDEFRGEPLGDVLVFLPTERDIHETMNVLRGSPAARDGRTELLPLYARLSAKEQQRVFEPHAGRRIVLATNVAESSLTVPGVRYVIDAGLARISRYSPRSKVQRLPIEAVSQASCDQRSGRCGRVAPGICVRLYSEEDYRSRDRFTPPEIVRTNLAAVILQTKSMRLGEIESFPFLEPPRHEMIRDGYQTLFELGALDDRHELTEVGKQLARLPLDPRVARMLLAARDERCLKEILIIAAALEVQDPRDRPVDKRQAADEAHQQFADPRSDFLAYLKIWDFYQQIKSQLTRGQLRKACMTKFLSYNRLREWSDVHRQLVQLLTDAWGRLADFGPGDSTNAQDDATDEAPYDERSEAGAAMSVESGSSNVPGGANEAAPQAGEAARRGQRLKAERTADRAEERRYAAIHRAILTGLLSGIAIRNEGAEYHGAGKLSLFLWPGSGAIAVKPQWIVAAELVETTRRYARTVAQIDPRWIEPLAMHLVNRTHGDAQWNGKSGTAMTNERISLFGLPIGKRRVPLAPIDPLATREMFMRHGLTEGDLDLRAPFFRHNQELREELARQAAKTRRADLVVEPQAIIDFYQARLPAEVVDAPSLNRWRQQAERSEPRRLFMTPEDLIGEPTAPDMAQGFPDAFPLNDVQLPLEYRFEPGVDDDGITLVVPKAALHQVTPERLGWLVPGLLEQKVEQLVRSLPKSWRRELPPAEEAARRALPLLRFGQGAFLEAVAGALSKVVGRPIPSTAFQLDKLPHFLHMNVRVTADDGRELASGRELDALQAKLGVKRQPTRELSDDKWRRDGIRKWDFGDLPERTPVVRGGVELIGFPTLVDRGETVSLRLLDGQYEAEQSLRRGARRLAVLAAGAMLREHVEWLPNYKKIALLLAPIVKPDQLKEQLVDLIADRAFLADGPPPRTEADFSARLVNPRRRCEGPVVEIARMIGPLAEAYQELRLSLETRRPQHFQAAIDDVRRQLGRLVAGDFLTTTPWEWLQHFPRYLKAMKLRIDRLTSAAARDAASMAEVVGLEKAWSEQAERNRAIGKHDAELDRYRWWLEEFRVSLFAQSLGTAVPVSPQRLAKQWALVSR